MTIAPTTSVVVTGASSGIGAAIARDLASRGWAVACVGRDQRRVEATVTFIRDQGGTAIAVLGDVAERTTHDVALAAALTLAPLRGWVNCAGVTIRNSLTDLSTTDTETMIHTNQYGTLWGTAAAVSHMAGTGGGAIVNMSSVHGRRAYPEHTVYEMTKAAIEALTRSVAVGYARAGIRANAVCPGAIHSAALDASFAAAPDPAAAEADVASRSPIGRIAEPSEVAAVVAFLLSSESSYVSGQSIAVDGGWTVALGADPDDPAARRPATAGDRP